MVPTDKVYLGLSMECTHLQQILGEIPGVLHMASKEKVLHHALHGQMLQVYVTLSLCTFKVVKKECREKEIVHLVPASGMGASSVKIMLYLFKCLWPC